MHFICICASCQNRCNVAQNLRLIGTLSVAACASSEVLRSCQAEFARELGISQGQLSRYEKGRSEIGAEILLRLARRSGKTVEWLLTGKDSA